MKKVAAVILNYNSSDDCRKCIDFLKKQDYPELKLIVVDNASTNKGEKDILRQLCIENDIQLILNNKNSGFSAGNNLGFRAASKEGAEWMLVINPDVELRDSHYISYVMEQLPKWPEAAVIGTNVVMPNGTPQNPIREITCMEEILWPFEMLRNMLGIQKGYRSEDKTGYCEKVSGCCFFVSSEFLSKNNYLDETVFMYCEEPIIAKSVCLHGYKELYIKEVTANHEHYSCKKFGDSRLKMLMFIESRIYFINKYSDYSPIVKKIAVFSRYMQGLFWKYQRSKRKKG